MFRHCCISPDLVLRLYSRMRLWLPVRIISAIWSAARTRSSPDTRSLNEREGMSSRVYPEESEGGVHWHL